VLALVKQLGLKAQFVELDLMGGMRKADYCRLPAGLDGATYWRESEMPFQDFPSIVGWIDGLMRIPAWADPWPAEA
jgi:hypothetical protein